ncbi:hypothetical protein EV702DRAFT_1041119 [Suillus placidus]|uniref:DUF6534 domain-containing protein n=1 Tax=Suillus placidus TaxID=48579 RepID=A0A9P7A6L8_9AGAM|nr:hypothetical protein EV702DRAFT_1041119 [Suillus placidus]
MSSLPAIYGAVLLGGFLASVLSGIITAQTFTYIKRYPTDTRITKSIYSILFRVLDSIHTSLWFGDEGKIDNIPASVFFHSLSISNIHCADSFPYFDCALTNTISVSLRIEFISVIFAFLRLGYIIKLLHLKRNRVIFRIELQTMTAFRHNVEWVFTAGLSFSCVVDVLVTASLCFTLRRSRGSYSNAATIISMICWVTMHNLVFLGVHFVLSKLYANSLLATLNSRKQLQEERSRGALSNELPVAFPGRYQSKYSKRLDPGNKLEINVERTIEYDAVNGFAKRSPHTPSETPPPTADPNHITSNAT